MQWHKAMHLDQSLGRNLFGMLGDVFFPSSTRIDDKMAKQIQKSNQVTREIRGQIEFVKHIEPREINYELKLFRALSKLVNQSVELVEELDDEYLEYKNAIRDFRNAFCELLEEIEYEAEKHEFSALSASVLEEVWGSPEDEVWDNF
ncbi:MAG: hypothetical protein ACOCVX_01285 [Bacteroidales bacterium]